MEEDKARKWRKMWRIKYEKIRGFTYKNSANDMVENLVFIAVENRAQYQGSTEDSDRREGGEL